MKFSHQKILPAVALSVIFTVSSTANAEKHEYIMRLKTGESPSVTLDDDYLKNNKLTPEFIAYADETDLKAFVITHIPDNLEPNARYVALLSHHPDVDEVEAIKIALIIQAIYAKGTYEDKQTAARYLTAIIKDLKGSGEYLAVINEVVNHGDENEYAKTLKHVANHTANPHMFELDMKRFEKPAHPQP